jgi:hypothetical protein
MHLEAVVGGTQSGFDWSHQTAELIPLTPFYCKSKPGALKAHLPGQVAGEEIAVLKQSALLRGYACGQRWYNRRTLAAGICGATVPSLPAREHPDLQPR